MPRLRSVARRLLPAGGREPDRGATVPVTGVVEHFSRRLVSGWLSVPVDAPPVQVSLHLGDLRVASTYATASPFMSGSQSVLREGAPADDQPGEGPAATTGAPLVHDWQRPDLPGPPEDRRNSTEQVRVFAFKVRGIWPFLRKRDRVTVRVAGRPLPIVGHGTYLNPPRNGKRSLGELRELLDRGHLLTQFGTVELAKSLDEVWQKKVIDLYADVRAFLEREHGYDAFLIGGTLLGAVREGGYIGHDVDFDAAYLSRHRTGPEAAEELVGIGLAFVRAGWAVECMRSNLHLMRPDDLDVRVDLFHVYFDTDDLFAFPWGIAGTSTVRRQDWRGTEEIDFPGGRALVPANAEQMVEHLYGADWRLPKPGFNWHIDRTAHAEEGTLSPEQRSVVWWADHHARTPPAGAAAPSPFAAWLLDRTGSDRPADPVVDLGCGTGGDACALASAGRTVLGADRSEPGVLAARALAERAGVARRARFEVADVADAGRLGALLAQARGDAGSPLLLVLRRLLCSVPEEVEDRLVAGLAEHLRPGDLVAVEVRGPAPESGAPGRPPRPVPLTRLRSPDEVAAALAGADLFVEHAEDAPEEPPADGDARGARDARVTRAAGGPDGHAGPVHRLLLRRT